MAECQDLEQLGWWPQISLWAQDAHLDEPRLTNLMSNSILPSAMKTCQAAVLEETHTAATNFWTGGLVGFILGLMVLGSWFGRKAERATKAAQEAQRQIAA